MKIFCGICDGTMELVWSGQAGDKWRCPNCDHEVDLPFNNPHGWIQPVAPDCPLDGHLHDPGEFCRGCHDLTGWTPPIFAVEPKTQADRDNAYSRRVQWKQDVRNRNEQKYLTRVARNISFGTFEENLTKGDEQFLESLKVGWK